MKLSDFAIVFSVIALCIFTIVSIKNELLYKNIIENARYNIIFDNAVEDALRAGFKDIDSKGRPIIDKEDVANYLFKEISMSFDSNTFMEEYYKNVVKVIIITSDEGFFCYDFLENSFGEQIKYSNGSETKHENKIDQILSYIEENYGILQNIPYNYGEDDINTIEDNSLLLVYKGYDNIIDGNNYNSYCFSGATIQKTLPKKSEIV